MTWIRKWDPESIVMSDQETSEKESKRSLDAEEVDNHLREILCVTFFLVGNHNISFQVKP